jgi:Skp family chaperone for outer membrane proteins
MKRTMLMMAGAAGIMLVVFSLTSNLYSQQAQDVKIGVVDLKEVSEGFTKWARLAKELEEESGQSNAKLEEYDGKIEKLQEALKDLDKESARYTETEIEIYKIQAEQKRFYQSEQGRLKKMAETLGGDLLDNIEKVIQQYGRANGYTLIIKKEDLPVREGDWEELRIYVTRKSVMYYASNIDITDKVIEILNKDYK